MSLPEAGEPVISLRGVTRRYGPRLALDGVTLDVPPGVTGLLGPNGAGKSTLVRILLGMDKATSGEVRVLGHDPATDGLTVRRYAGYSPEGPSLVPGLSGVEQVALAAELAGFRRRNAILRAHECLAFVGLEDARYRHVDGYSTGMKQRLKLAQAVATAPRLLVLDEPTNGLDPEGRRDVIRMIRTLAERDGVSVLLSSHVLRDVEGACRWAIVLREGKVVSEGPIETHRTEDGSGGETGEGASAPRSWVVRVLGDADRFRALATEKGAAIEALEGGASCRIELADAAVNGDGPRPIYTWAKEVGASVLECRPARTSLEETYLRAFGQERAT